MEDIGFHTTRYGRKTWKLAFIPRSTGGRHGQEYYQRTSEKQYKRRSADADRRLPYYVVPTKAVESCGVHKYIWLMSDCILC